MRDLGDLFDLCDLVVGAAEGRVTEPLRADAADRIGQLRVRSGQAAASLVVAIVGATGSGKSSLLNAIAGQPVAGTGRVRPYTQEPTAWVPAIRDIGLEAMLDDLDITDRFRHDGMPGLALIDMPDIDSIVRTHRDNTEHMMKRVDGFLWVLDPEKYHDPLLHDEFLAPMAAYSHQTTFVLNKIDTLGRDAFPSVVVDVAKSLTAAGYSEPKLFPVAAAPNGGADPEGMQPLVEYLSERLDVKRTAYGKLLADIAAVVRDIGVASGVWRGGSIRFSGRWVVTREAALAALRPSSRAPSEDALCRIEDLVAAAAAEIGGPAGDEMRQRLKHDAVLEALTVAQGAVAEDDRAAARVALDEGVAVKMRELLWDRSRFAALVAEAHMGIRAMVARYGVTLE